MALHEFLCGCRSVPMMKVEPFRTYYFLRSRETIAGREARGLISMLHYDFQVTPQINGEFSDC